MRFTRTFLFQGICTSYTFSSLGINKSDYVGAVVDWLDHRFEKFLSQIKCVMLNFANLYPTQANFPQTKYKSRIFFYCVRLNALVYYQAGEIHFDGFCPWCVNSSAFFVVELRGSRCPSCGHLNTKTWYRTVTAHV